VGLLAEEASVDTRVIEKVQAENSRGSLRDGGVFRRVIPPPEKSSGPVETVSRGTIPLKIESSPSGALVEVDGRELGRTPLLREKFRKGNLTVRLKRSGYRTWKDSIKLTQPTRVKIKLREK
jgi:hypothetical protein